MRNIGDNSLGGAIFCSEKSTCAISGCAFSKSEGAMMRASKGAAISVDGKGSRAIVSTSTFSDLSATSAGAVSVTEGGQLDLTSSMFKECTASSGPAIVLEDSEPSIISLSTFEGNSATYDGGAIRAERSQVTITKTVIRANEAGKEGGAISLSLGTTLMMVLYTVQKLYYLL